MRIISGRYKGRRLVSSQDLSIRPTTGRIKEQIFNILQDFSSNRPVADVFSGSGNLGLEALSRGAKKVFFVEKALSSVNVLIKNLENLGVPDDTYRIIQKDALEFAHTYDYNIELFLLDPPFVYPQLQELIDAIFLNPHYNPEALVVVEHEITNPIHRETTEYSILKQKKKGRSLISFIEKRDNHA